MQLLHKLVPSCRVKALPGTRESSDPVVLAYTVQLNNSNYSTVHSIDKSDPDEVWNYHCKEVYGVLSSIVKL